MSLAGDTTLRSMPFLPALVLALSTAAVGQDVSKDLPPIDTGMVERTGVTLLLLDVRVADDRGRPIRGLELADFKVALDGRDWPVQSVDDLCACADPPDPTTRAAGQPRALPPAADPATSGSSFATPIATVRFVLHFDFSQLGLDGRGIAVEEGQRWIRETMQPQDRVMVTAYAADAGLVVLADFTGDKERLAEAVREACDSPKFRDSFPVDYESRVDECKSCCKQGSCNCDACWAEMGWREYLHSRGALRALRTLLERLEAQEGRKALLFFNQRGSMFPARYYPVKGDRVGDHVSLVDEIAAEAVLSRTAIYTAYTGLAGHDPNLGANLSDMTGGQHSKPLSDLSELTSIAGRDCECIYRLGLTPPERERHVYRATVKVQGRRLDASYRVRYLGEVDRWMRSARNVLAQPENATDIALASALVPTSGRKDGWDVKVQIAIDPTQLELLPEGSKARGDWEIGALLIHDEGQHTWEMLGVSEVRRSQGGRARMVEVLHQRTFEGLPPGRYELRAFVRDRWANLYGGDLAEIELPNAAREGLAGPVVLRARGAHVPTSLPLRKRAVEAATRDAAVVTEGALPLYDRPVVSGEPLEFLSWVCPGQSKDSIWGIQRYVSRDDQPLFRFEDVSPTRAGDCATLRDHLDTSPMGPGHYTYHVLWRRAPTIEPERAQASFVIGDVFQAPP